MAGVWIWAQYLPALSKPVTLRRKSTTVLFQQHRIRLLRNLIEAVLALFQFAHFFQWVWDAGVNQATYSVWPIRLRRSPQCQGTATTLAVTLSSSALFLHVSQLLPTRKYQRGSGDSRDKPETDPSSTPTQQPPFDLAASLAFRLHYSWWMCQDGGPG